MDQASFTEICLHQLKMSGVHEGEKLVVLTQGNERLNYADAFMAAGQRLGATMYHMRLPAPLPTGSWEVGVTGLAALPEAVEALKQCDMLIDVTYQLNTSPTIAEYACTDTPGRWDHWPSGFVFTGGDDDGVDGQIVVAPGDILLPQNMYVREPITYTIEKGWITDIRGGLDAELVKSYMASFNDPRGMGMSHVGWGMNPHAKWHNMTPGAFPGGMGMEPRSFYGNVIPMRSWSLFLDDEPIVIDVDIVVKEIQMQRD